MSKGRSGVPKDFQPLLAAALDDGWELVRANGMLKVVAPDGYAVRLPTSTKVPPNVFRVVRSKLRHHGLDV